MKIGMPTLIEFNSIEENIALCKMLNLDFVEINMNMNYCLPKHNDVNKLYQLLSDYNLTLTMHFPEEIDFGTPFEVIRDANILLFEEFCLYGSKIKVEKINVHLPPGTVVTLPNKKVYAYSAKPELFYQNLIDSLHKIVVIASRFNIKVCVENVEVPVFLIPAFEYLSRIKGLSFTYDIGHDAKANYSVLNIYKNLAKKVGHMHFHDYDGKTDHQVLFKGNIDLIDRLNFAKDHRMSVVVEVKTKEALIESINELRLRKLI